MPSYTVLPMQYCDAKVEQFDLTILQQHDIFWLDVAVDHSVLVSIGQRCADVKKDVYHFRRGEQFGRIFPHRCPQGSPPQVLQYQVLPAPLLAAIQVTLDVGMAEAIANLYFAFVALENRRA